MNPGSFPEALVLNVKKQPDKVFIMKGEERLTFRQHLAAALSFMDRLAEIGVKKGDKVIICTQQTLSCLNAFMATVVS